MWSMSSAILGGDGIRKSRKRVAPPPPPPTKVARAQPSKLVARLVTCIQAFNNQTADRRPLEVLAQEAQAICNQKDTRGGRNQRRGRVRYGLWWFIS